MHDEHVPFGAVRVAALRRLMVKHLDVPGTAPPCDHLGVQAVGKVENLLLSFQQGLPGQWHIGHVDHLHLADEKRIRHGRHVAAGQPGGPGRPGQPRDDGRLLDGKRHDDLSRVDQEVERDAHRQPENADHVLDHLVGEVELQRVRARVQRGEVFLGQRRAITKRFDARSHAQFEEIRDSRPRPGRRDVGCH